jgi:bifunctional ADP-heptose synthase (sugar kinase/adenylyltransferase)
MDTRVKIVDAQAALAAARQRRSAGQRIRLVTGYFDPVLASHARRLSELAAPAGALFVSVTEPPRPILAARARAELVAALAAVDYVTVGAVETLAADDIHHEEAADERRAYDLIAHVQSRNRL